MENEKKYLEHIRAMLHDKNVPEPPEELAEEPLFAQIYEELKATREITLGFSAGDFSSPIIARGFIPGCLKTLQANLRHLIWQVQMVEKGDFSQRVRFMGEFSTAFNSMVNKLRWSLSELQEKEKNLEESEAHFRFLANHDPLTGVYNRRSFLELAEANLSDAASKSIPCCLAMMDIDHFKNFNDTYGHLAGDEALRHAVKITEACLRKDDFMGRYGGEEFIIFFYNTDEESGLSVVKRLRKNLAENPVLLETGWASIHASFGVASSLTENPNNKDYMQKLINNADVALYAAKKAGRNRAMLFTPPS
jgi:diguanylate cyclase (GGDEF)-like protein